MEQIDARAKAMARVVMPALATVPLLVAAYWIAPLVASSSWHFPVWLFFIVVTLTVYVWAFHATVEAQKKNAALDAYLDQIEVIVHGRLLGFDFVEMPNSRQLYKFVKEIFYEEIRNRKNVPLAGSPYWSRALLLANIGPRVERLVGILQQPEEEQSTK